MNIETASSLSFARKSPSYIVHIWQYPPPPAEVYLYFPLVINEVKSTFASLERKNETFVLRPEIKRTVNAKFRALNANIKSRIFCTHRQNKSRQHKFQMHFQEVLFYLFITRTFNR